MEEEERLEGSLELWSSTLPLHRNRLGSVLNIFIPGYRGYDLIAVEKTK